MNVKILCSCGSKYSFDLDQPVLLSAASVACPACGADGTDAANDIIREAMGTGDSAPAPDPVPQAAPTASPLSQQPVPHRLASPPPSVSQSPALKDPKPKRAYGEPNLAMGTVGAVVGAFVGMMIWFFLIKATHIEFGIIAWGVGGLTGFVCRVLGAGYSRLLGLVAAACAFLAIVGGELLATQSMFDEFLTEALDGAYEAAVADAQGAADLETDDQIRHYLAEQAEAFGLSIGAAVISEEDVQVFRDEDLPKLRELANGRPPKAEYEESLRQEITAEMRGEVFKASFSFWTLLWLLLGVGSAWRLGTGETQ